MWKEIEGYDGYYEVSDTGLVRSLDRHVIERTGKRAGQIRLLRGSLMKQTISTAHGTPDGYPVVSLHKNGKSRVIPVHSLVAKAFLPNPHNLPTINHKNGEKCDNRVENLEWASYSENNTHALQHGLRRPRGVPIGQFNENGDLVATFRSETHAARETGISRGCISHCLHGRLKVAGGYIWKKLTESATTIPQGSTQEDELPAEAQRPHDVRKI